MKRKLLSDGVVLSALHMVNDGYVACLPLFLPFITQDINITLSQAGFLGGILHFSGVVLAFSWSCSRSGSRPSIWWRHWARTA